MVDVVSGEIDGATSGRGRISPSDIAVPLLISPKVLSGRPELGFEPIGTTTKERSGS